MSETRIHLSAQHAACETAVRCLVGGAKPSTGERRLLADRLRAAAVTLRFIEQYDMEFRDFIRRKREGETP